MENEDVLIKASIYFTGDFFLKLVDVWFGLQKKRYHLQIHEQEPKGWYLWRVRPKKTSFLGKKFKMQKKRKNRHYIRKFWSSLKTTSYMFEG